MTIESLNRSGERKKAERVLRSRLAAEPGRADLWAELGHLLETSDQEPDQRTAESCWQRAKLIDPTIQIETLPYESVTTAETEPEAVHFERPLLEQAGSSQAEPRPDDSALVDGFFAESSATDRTSLDSLFKFPFACPPIVITGGEFCGTEQLFGLMSGHASIVAIDVAGKTPEELHSALRDVDAGQRVLIHAPEWEYRLESLAQWPEATVVWLDRDADERATEMAAEQLVLERFGPWGVMRSWSVHPDGGPLAFERCLKQFEFAGNTAPSTLRKSWERLQNTRPFRRTSQQAKWLAPEYCRMLSHFWRTSSSETSIRVTTNELAKSSEAVVRRVLAFASLPIDEAHILDNAAAENNLQATARSSRTASLWC